MQALADSNGFLATKIALDERGRRGGKTGEYPFFREKEQFNGKNKTLKGVNVASVLLLVNQAATGMPAMKLPHGVFERRHRRAAWLLITAAAVHLALSWNWVKVNYFRKNN